MLSTPTLQMARRRFKSLLEKSKDEPYMAADCMCAQIAIDCIDYCITAEARRKARQKADEEVAAALNALFDGR